MGFWQSIDLGSPKLTGSFKTNGDGIDIVAGGRDIWEKDDEAHFVYHRKGGDFEVTCRVESLTSADLYTKAGIMAREDTAASSRFVYFQIFPTNDARNKNNGGYEFSYREMPAADCHAIYPPDAPGDPAKYPISFPNVWMRLTRKGDHFTASVSDDGDTWKRYTQFTLPLKSQLLLGFAVTSHNTEQAVTAKFRDITVV